MNTRSTPLQDIDLLEWLHAHAREDATKVPTDSRSSEAKVVFPETEIEPTDRPHHYPLIEIHIDDILREEGTQVTPRIEN